jgi:hypothetical protein
MLVLLVVSSKDCDGSTSNAAVSVGPVVRACDTSLGTAADFVNCLSMNAASSGEKRPAAPLIGEIPCADMFGMRVPRYTGVPRMISGSETIIAGGVSDQELCSGKARD